MGRNALRLGWAFLYVEFLVTDSFKIRIAAMGSRCTPISKNHSFSKAGVVVVHIIQV